MAEVGTVARVMRCPVKSMRGEEIDAGRLGPEGLEGDRRWGVLDADSGKVLSAKRVSELLDARATLPDPDGVPVVEIPDHPPLAADDPEVDRLLTDWLDRPVRLAAAEPGHSVKWDMHVSATDPETEWFELMTPPGTFYDAGPVHLLTTGSVAAAEAEYPGGDWDVRRFRPTVLVDTGSGAGFVENDWLGGTLTIGEAELAAFAPTIRCVMTTRAQDDLGRDLEIVKTVNRVNESNLGIYATIATPGMIRVGDPVQVTSG